MRRIGVVVICLMACAVGVGLGFYFSLPKAKKLPDPPALVMQLRDVARLETLEVTLYKKVSFEPDPQLTGTLWKDVATWARYTMRPPKGKAIVFATAHLGFDFKHFGPENIRVTGERVEVVLPQPQVQVELNPGETEIIGSNLDSKDTAQLFNLAKDAFAYEVRNDAELNGRARRSAESAMRSLLLTLGFREVAFVESIPLAPAL